MAVNVIRATPAPAGLLTALRVLSAHLVVALVALVAIGGATRVMEAGLACPDWPLCYGTLLPGRQMNLQVFLEWFHRLDAFLVGLALLVMGALSLRFRSVLPRWLPWATMAALMLVILQGALGALTVIQLLASSTVTAHLGTALLLVLLMSGIHQALEVGSETPGISGGIPSEAPPWWWLLPTGVCVLVMGQCLIGGAMASQWAADRCFQFGEGCRWLALHRYAAWPSAVGVIVMAAASALLPPWSGRVRTLVFFALFLVLLQVALGVLTLRLQLAVAAVTVGHQLTAALLVAVIGALLGLLEHRPTPRFSPTTEVLDG